VLASSALHTEALAELKAMLTRYMGIGKDSDEGNPLLSKTVFENHVTMPSAGVPNTGVRAPEGPVEGEVEKNIEVSSSPPHLDKKVSNDHNLVERPDADVADAPTKQGTYNEVPAMEGDSNPGSGSADPGRGTLVKPQHGGSGLATTSKVIPVETRRGIATQLTKAVVVSKEDSNPYSMDGTSEGNSDPVVGGPEAPDVRKMRSPKKQKKATISPTKVNVSSTVGEGESTPFVGPGISDDVVAGSKGGGAKLLIMNLHRTLLDNSLIAEKNPNAAIRYSIITGTQRVVFRPWLREFLRRCFINFIVAFWGSKSECYMDEVTAAVLTGLKDGQSFKPLFVWSGKHCDTTDFEDGAPICWGKPLSKVFQLWPVFNLSITVIMDHKSFRVGYNPLANVIIPTLFYVQGMEKLEEDKKYLKSYLWPLLEKFFASVDIA
jgi:hypothetical protein